MSLKSGDALMGYWVLLYSHGQNLLHTQSFLEYLKSTKRDLKRAEGPHYIPILISEDTEAVYRAYDKIQKTAALKKNVNKPFSYSVREVMDQLDFLGNKRPKITDADG